MAHLEGMLPRGDVLSGWTTLANALEWAKVSEDLLKRVVADLGEDDLPDMATLAAVEPADVRKAFDSAKVPALKRTRLNLLLNALRKKYGCPLCDYTKPGETGSSSGGAPTDLAAVVEAIAKANTSGTDNVKVDGGVQDGSRVQVAGLRAEPQHNGWQGVALSLEENVQAADARKKGRTAVRLDSGLLLSLQPANLRPVAYVVSPVNGKGMGVTATRDITYGERLIAEPPLITISKGMTASEIMATVNKLSETKRAVFDGLHNAQILASPINDCTSADILGIMNTNVLSIDKDMGLSGLFGIISRFNHSCIPNVAYNWNDKLQAETVHACRDIRCGEELCVSYMSAEANPGLCSSQDQRRANLKKWWGFLCSCPACNLMGKDLARSDTRRQLIFKLDGEILQAIQWASNAEGERLVQTRLKLLSEEQLDEPIVKQRTSYDAYQACKYAGRHDRAREWLESSAKYALASSGADSAVYDRYLRMLRRPIDAPHDPCHA